MKKLLPFLLPLLTAGIGIGGGFFARSSLSLEGDKKPSHIGEEKNDKHDKSSKNKTKKKDGHSSKVKEKSKKYQKKKDTHGKDKKAEKKSSADKKKKKSGKKDKHGGGGAGNYMKFSRQFVIPLIENEEVVSMMIFDLNLAMKPDADSDYYIHEPKARDALMRGLLELAQQGIFFRDIGAKRNLDYIKAKLLQDAQEALGHDVDHVLILDMVRQDV